MREGKSREEAKMPSLKVESDMDGASIGEGWGCAEDGGRGGGPRLHDCMGYRQQMRAGTAMVGESKVWGAGRGQQWLRATAMVEEGWQGS
ncbi:hypothetical protein B296_00034845 [Ensete ventricosum]|uniref:Uncharacterized protein n=1 Tax=Ensete ventricosum TaxID=4639 RepID=A0A427A758_ENSVE|nr:hypothetical protein B296_00034845 [Ensete ventricosum]